MSKTSKAVAARRRRLFLWAILFLASVALFALTAPHHPHAGVWALIPLTLTAWAITAELTETKETT